MLGRLVLFALLLALAPFGVLAAAPSERVQIADPFIELHTGPGRGYPVFHVAARAEWITLELRHTDWFRVRTADGKVGWVERAQLETTLTEAGGKKTFRDIALDDYLRRRLEFGAAWGRFKSEPMLKAWLGYKIGDAFALEATAGQVQGTFSGADFWHLGLMAEPFSDRRLAPFLGIGVGRFRDIPNASLVGAQTTDAKMALAAAGARFHLTERFVARAEFTLYTAFLSDSRTRDFRAFTAGLSFFF